MPTILITGGTRGIGFALAQAFAQNGWAVEACYHQDEVSASHARETLKKFNPACGITRCDVARPPKFKPGSKAFWGDRR